MLNFKWPPLPYFSLSQKSLYKKLFIRWRSISRENFMVPRWVVQLSYPSQKSERPHVWNDNLPTEFHKNVPTGPNVINGRAHTDKQTDNGELTSLTFLFRISRLKTLLIETKRRINSQYTCKIWGQNVLFWCLLAKTWSLKKDYNFIAAW